jgi:hypothetical protein
MSIYEHAPWQMMILEEDVSPKAPERKRPPGLKIGSSFRHRRAATPTAERTPPPQSHSMDRSPSLGSPGLMEHIPEASPVWMDGEHEVPGTGERGHLTGARLAGWRDAWAW